MWDARDGDAGVYFVTCRTGRDVERVLTRCGGDGAGQRLLGIFDAATSADKQWPGLNYDDWRLRNPRLVERLRRKLRKLTSS